MPVFRVWTSAVIACPMAATGNADVVMTGGVAVAVAVTVLVAMFPTLSVIEYVIAVPLPT